MKGAPPWLAEPHVQEYLNDLSLDEDVVAVFAGWRDAGFPRGEPRPDPETRPGPEGAFPADLSLELLPGGSYTPDPSMADDYRCFLVDWPREEPGYVTGFRVAPGNLRLAHHSIVNVVEPELVDRFRELEEEEEGPGYQCFSFGTPDRLHEEDEREAYLARYPDGVEDLLDGSRPGIAGDPSVSEDGVTRPFERRSSVEIAPGPASQVDTSSPTAHPAVPHGPVRVRRLAMAR